MGVPQTRHDFRRVLRTAAPQKRESVYTGNYRARQWQSCGLFVRIGKGENMARDFPKIRAFGSAVVALLLAALGWPPPAAAATPEPPIRRGVVHFVPDPNEQTAVPKPFQLPAGTFAFEQTPQPSVSDDVSVSLITFPSPVKTKYENNNTVHCEYYCPNTPGKHPACVVLHILGGDFPLARTFATALAHRGVSSLFVIMPYYGPRRPAEGNVRMISADPQQTIAGMTQAVKDIRYAAAWLAAEPEVDKEQVGVFGISLGGITAALAGAVEPRFHKICPVLAGGNIALVLWESTDKHAIEARQHWLANGGTRDSLLELMKTVDPATYGDRIHGRKVLMLNASHDEVIPKKCTEALWQAFGKPKILWYDAGHYSAMFHLVDAIGRVTDFFQPEAKSGCDDGERGRLGSATCSSSGIRKNSVVRATWPIRILANSAAVGCHARCRAKHPDSSARTSGELQGQSEAGPSRGASGACRGGIAPGTRLGRRCLANASGHQPVANRCHAAGAEHGACCCASLPRRRTAS